MKGECTWGAQAGESESGVKIDDENARARFADLVAQLRTRKRRLYPRDERFIAAWDVSLLSSGDFFVQAAGVTIE
jgi:hypothetical protein